MPTNNSCVSVTCGYYYFEDLNGLNGVCRPCHSTCYDCINSDMPYDCIECSGNRYM